MLIQNVIQTSYGSGGWKHHHGKDYHKGGKSHHGGHGHKYGGGGHHKKYYGGNLYIICH